VHDVVADRRRHPPRVCRRRHGPRS
jgi:hypothetical protein